MRLNPFHPFARGLVIAALLLAVLAGLAGSAGQPPRLYVFHPALVRPLALQDALARRCPGLSITVFGRLTDFQAKVASDDPEALLALPVVLRQYDAWQPRLQGLRKGQPSEPYVLLSLDKPADPAKMDGVTLGVVGLLERKPMADFVQQLVKGAPRLDRVTKVEDLLPLLTFRSASAVLVSEAVAAEFRRKSQANLVSVKVDGAKLGLAALALKKGLAGAAEAEVVKAIQGLQPEEMELLGVDAWK